MMYTHPCISYFSIAVMKHMTKATLKTKCVSWAHDIRELESIWQSKDMAAGTVENFLLDP